MCCLRNIFVLWDNISTDDSHHWSTFPLKGGNVTAFGVGDAVAAAHAVLTLRTAGEMGMAAGTTPVAVVTTAVVGGAGFGG